MSYFIGIVPPDHILKTIISLQTKWKENQIIHVAEPHITVKAQSGLTNDKGWIGKINDIGTNFKPFLINLGKPDFFGESVLYLTVESNDINELHQTIIKTLSPNPDDLVKYLEGELYIPHLTLGQTQFGMSYEELKKMYLDTEKFEKFSFEVRFLRIYVETNNGRYEKLIDVDLLG
ncbi:2'-5' RNA ligase family protein [Alkalicoccobacillus murimartini]|uniref:2'-5' RNA ligase n=1 Tax=Alkalicoccobacillus murimartini TaxID=171685 RepID=A0ABT9YBZ8_9BACI|nr:2'-5' RNA ligase family protein [Alkalicoccobacillus murimartini]MDQ0205368.1 2'-5' RNA ligase [Alkalicoccobacillus murimartini]